MNDHQDKYDSNNKPITKNQIKMTYQNKHKYTSNNM